LSIVSKEKKKTQHKPSADRDRPPRLLRLGVGFLEISEINMAKQKQLSPKYQVWIDARKIHKLSHAHIQMARELGMNPKKFGKLDNHKQEPWKAPLPIFIEDIYFKRFGKERPDNVRSIEQMVKDKKHRQLERKQRKLKEKEKSQQDAGEGPGNMVPF
jgi:hypothetical protein